MIKADGNKIAVTMVLTKDLNDFAERRSAELGLNKSAFIRMLIAQEAEREKK